MKIKKSKKKSPSQSLPRSDSKSKKSQRSRKRDSSKKSSSSKKTSLTSSKKSEKAESPRKSLKSIEYSDAVEKSREKKKSKNKNFITQFLSKASHEDQSNLASNESYFLLENHPYYFSPSFLHHNGKFSTIVQLYARTGSNRHLTYDSIIDLIPVNALDGISMQFIVHDALIKGDEKKRLIRKNARSGKNATEDVLQHGSKEDKDNQSSIQAKMSEYDDYNEYELILDKADPIVVFKIFLNISGESMEDIDEQIAILNTLLDQRHEGLKWDSLGGDQYDRFTQLFTSMPKDRFSMSSTSENYSGINFSVNAGLNDRKGIPIGVDALSLSSCSSYFDMFNSTRKQAIIAIPRSAIMQRYTREDEVSQPSVSSIFAQSVANHSHMNGSRVHHLVLNDFDYFEKELYFRPIETLDLFEKFDVSKMTINPLQGFGDVEKVVGIYGRLTKKIVDIFDLLNNLQLTQDERAVILNVVEQFYSNQRLWIPDAELYPKRTRIVGIERPETYPTMGVMINEFTTLATRASKDNRELKADRIDTLGSILNQAITSNMGVLGRPTSIKESTAPQVYYDFNSMSSEQMKQVQFVNIIDYIIYTAKRGDLIVLHGCDRLWSKTLNMVSESIKAAQEDGIKFLFCFDTIQSKTSRIDKMADLFGMQGSFYTDLDADVDWSAVGKCLPEEVKKYEESLNSELSMTIRNQMMAKSNCQVLIHRNLGDVNNFVYLNVLI